ncbi:SDR family oxidoreductase [Nocardia sp. XZ_19_385]|uniref:SDR family oxidoreductase n=1 Tax=Nocardia sp. XZ_19_385 TaxID=2769488 RepID=UPI0018903622|nr:NAD(P)H-binding protein [Nocardia sp. XZ_19_385]
MLLVTGATGNIGRPLLQELHASNAGPLRALTRDAARTTFPGGVEAASADLADSTSLRRALDGVRSMLLVSGLGPDADIIDTARRAGVEHVVLVSSITVQTHPHLLPAAEKSTVEMELKASGMDWTILRPTQFASNTLLWAEAIREHRPVRVPYADTGLPTIHPADIAAVARVTLTEPGHRGRTYALTGPERITPRQQAAAIATALHRNIEFAEISPEAARADMLPFFGPASVDAVLDVTGGDLNDELLQVRDTVPHLTGTPARPFHLWAQENAPAFR